MGVNKLIGWTGCANIMAGILTALFWLIHPDPSLINYPARLTAMWKFDYGLFLIVLIFTLFALVGIIARQIEKINLGGLLGFVLSFTGTAVFIGAGTFDGFISPTLAASEKTLYLLSTKGPLISSLMPIFMFGGLSFAIGYILLGIFIMKAGILPKWAGLLLILSGPILGLSPLMLPMARLIGSSAFGLANIWLGYDIWSKR